MRIVVLGAAAGGGYPQWNCGCPNCNAVRAGSSRTEPRTQDSIALTADEASFHVVNASPDILAQIRGTPALHPRAPRHSPIRSLVLTNGDMDHVLGLFSLRESYPLRIYATAAVWRGLTERNVFFRTLQRFPGHTEWGPLRLDESVDLDGGLSMTPFAVPGKLPVHLERDSESSPEDNVGLVFRHHGKTAVYCSAAGALGSYTAHFEDADCIFFDGTFWSSAELVDLGLSKARAESMAHLPVGGERGSLRGLATVRCSRKIFTHLNNTNPLLLRGSEPHRETTAAGWEIACDGMEISL
jgi:pyrroloquinoline quinone biosynthesis protein B